LPALASTSELQFDFLIAGFSACTGRTGANKATHAICTQMSNRAAAVRMSAFYRRKRAVKSKDSV
jgi:hypothetical protein